MQGLIIDNFKKINTFAFRNLKQDYIKHVTGCI